MADTAIVGAGASGMLAAALLRRAGVACDLYEKMDRCGLKLGITGKGRCNLTNACDPETFFAQIQSGGRFLRSALTRYDSAWVRAFFEERLGVALKVERGERVFPVSDRALDVVGALLRDCDREPCRLRREAVEAIERTDGGFLLRTAQGERRYRRVLVATGGKSYPQTGSTGDGYRFAAALGHTIVPPRASLTGLCSPDGFCAEMSGLSLKNIGFTLFRDGKKVYEELGEALFAHFGLSGPLALTASAILAHGEWTRAEVLLDWKPGLTPEKLDARILREFSDGPNKALANAIRSLLPASAVGPVLAAAGVDGGKAVHDVIREERRRLCEILKRFPIAVSGLRPIEEAVVTAGGVSLKEVSPKTMESKLCPGLYFAGEVLDADALTGGFNLQIAFSTAAAAAEAIAGEEDGYVDSGCH